MGQLTEISRKLYLEDNSLSGSVPSELGALSSVQYLHLNGNSLVGSLPTEIGLRVIRSRAHPTRRPCSLLALSAHSRCEAILGANAHAWQGGPPRYQLSVSAVLSPSIPPAQIDQPWPASSGLQ